MLLLNWKFWVVVIVIVVLLGLVLSKNKTCKREGAKLGVPFRCKFMSSEPVTLIAEEHYYGKRDGKCYDIINYGSEMSFKEVHISNCETSEEKKRRQEQNKIIEVEYF